MEPDCFVLFSSKSDLNALWDRMAKKYILGIMKSQPSEKSRLVFYQGGVPQCEYSGDWTEDMILNFCLGQIQDKKGSSLEDYLYTFSDDA